MAVQVLRKLKHQESYYSLNESKTTIEALFSKRINYNLDDEIKSNFELFPWSNT